MQLGQYEALEAGMFSLKNFQFHTGRLSRHNESVRLKSIDSIDGESGGLAAVCPASCALSIEGGQSGRKRN